MITLDQLVAGGILAAILTGLFAGIHILLNKKVRVPAETERAGLVERNEMLANYKAELDTARAEIRGLRTDLNEERKRGDEQDKALDILQSEMLANEHYIYRCIGTIYRLGTAEDIPKPPPTRIRLTDSKGDRKDG